MIKNLSMTNVIILLIYFFIHSNHCFADQSLLIHAGERQLIGNPKTLSILRDIRVGQHNIVHSRWFVDQNINEVMSTLVSQVPTDTIAWSNGLVMQMHWSSEEYSHVLALMPESDRQVSFALSSVRLQPNDSLSAISKTLSAQSFNHRNVAYLSLKNLLSEPDLSSELLMEIRDDTEHAEALSLLYVSSRPIYQLEEMLRRLLAFKAWTLIETSAPVQSLRVARSFEAMRPGAVLRMDLIENIGRTFLHLNLSRGT